MGRRALGRPISARRAIATAFRDCRREERRLGDDVCCGGLVSPISNTVGGWLGDPKQQLLVGRLLSGHWARGSSGYTTPGLSLVASPASHVGLVIDCLEGSPEKGLVQGCSREGEEKPDPELFTLVRVAVKSCLGSGWAGL